MERDAFSVLDSVAKYNCPVPFRTPLNDFDEEMLKFKKHSVHESNIQLKETEIFTEEDFAFAM